MEFKDLRIGNWVEYWQKKGVELEIYPDNKLVYCDNIDIRYIHELQNLLSLIGIDDSVILDIN